MAETEFDDVVRFFEESAKKFWKEIEAGNTWQARLAASSFVQYIADRVSMDTSETSEYCHEHLLAVLLAAHRDFVDCFEVIKCPNARLDLIEFAWCRLMDTMDRIAVAKWIGRLHD